MVEYGECFEGLYLRPSIITLILVLAFFLDSVAVCCFFTRVGGGLEICYSARLLF